MKRTTILSLLMLCGYLLFSQKTPEMYMATVPKYPGNPCSITDADTANIAHFRKEINTYLDSLDADVTRRSDAMERFIESNEDQIRENVLTQQGYSKADANRLKNADKMSEEEKEAIANAMLMEKMGMDLNDFKDLADMDTASQKRWAQGYGTMMMADAMANPQKSQDEQKELRDRFELQQEQQFMIEKIRAGQMKYFDQFDTLQKQADQAYEKMMDEFKNLDEQEKDCQNTDCIEAIYEQKNLLRRDYCYRFTPKFQKITNDFRIYIVNSFDEFDAFDIINNKVTEAQTGIKNTAFEPGLTALSMVLAYAQKEAAVFKFSYAESEFIAGEDGGTSE